MREIAVLSLDCGNISSTAAGTEVDLAYYYASPGKREMKAILGAVPTPVAGSDSGSLIYQIQESNTTVDSDFTDISGAVFTTLTEVVASGLPQDLHFFSAKRYIRGNRTVTSAATTFDTVCTLLVTKRDS